MILPKPHRKSSIENQVDLFIAHWRGVAERLLSALLADPAAGVAAFRAVGLRPQHIPFDDLTTLLEIILAAVDRGAKPTIELICRVADELHEPIESRNIEHLWLIESSLSGLENYIAILIDYQRRAVLAKTLRQVYGILLDQFAPSRETVNGLEEAIRDWRDGDTTEPPKLTRPAPIIIRPRHHGPSKKTSCLIGGAV